MGNFEIQHPELDIFYSVTADPVSAVAMGVGEVAKMTTTFAQNKKPRSGASSDYQKELQACSKGKDTRGIFGRRNKKNSVSECKAEALKRYQEKEKNSKELNDKDFELTKYQISLQEKQAQDLKEEKKGQLMFKKISLFAIPIFILAGIIIYKKMK